MFSELAQFALAAYFSLAPPAWKASLASIASSPKFLAAYRADERAVTNWRTEASLHLELDPSIARAFGEGGDPISTPRCVKLNNYWCIKGTGWNGMLAADTEGHAAFDSAKDGAAVAVLLLRRYYLDFSRRSAQAIVSRWAPAQCGNSGLTALSNNKPSMRGARRSVVARPMKSSARRKTATVRFSAIDFALAPPRALSLLRLTVSLPQANVLPLMSCADDTVRIRNYAMKVIEGVVNSVDDDLKLFEPDGRPTANLARVMLNMAGVEIGPLKVDPDLVKNSVDNAMTAARLLAEDKAARENNVETTAAKAQ